jgi:uncharacterized protein (TIGR02246 family)
MLRKTLAMALLALAALMAACSSAPTPAPAPAAPPDTRAADVQAIKDIEADWLKASQAKDADKWASYFADDGSALYPGMTTLEGKAAVSAAMAAALKDPNYALDFHSTRVVASKGGDMVYAQGTYTMTTTNPKTKKLVNDKGKYLTIYQKQADGSWKVVADTFNSDLMM